MRLPLLMDNGLPEVSLHDNAVLLDELPDARELVVPVLAHQLRDPVARTVQSTARLSVYVQFVEGLYCKRTIQCLASSELLTPPPPSPPVVGKHPDLMVGQPTSTVFPTIGRNFEIS